MRCRYGQKAQGDATAFDKVYEQYKLAPDVTRRRMYYETMEQVLSKVDKTIIEAPGVTPYLPLPQVQKSQPREPAPMIDFVRSRPILTAVLGIILLFVLLGSFPIVPETKQAVVVRFGKPVRILNRYRPVGRSARPAPVSPGASRSPRTSCGSTSACSMSTCRPSRCSRPTSGGSRSTPSPATGSSIR